MDTIAILKCLGLRPREVSALYAAQTVLLGVAGSLAGVLGGVLAQWIAPSFLEGVFPTDLIRPWQPMAIVRGLLLGVGVALLFSLAPLAAVWRVPPARVFRREAEPLRAGRAVRGGLFLVLLAGIFATAWVQARSAMVAASFTAGGILLVLVLAGGARAVMVAVARLPRERFRVWLRHGLTALARPGAGTLGAVVALGLGVTVVLGMYLVEDGLGGQLERELPEDSPSAFMVDIQPDQWAGVRGILEEEGASGIDWVAVVMARLRTVDGAPVEELAKETSEGERRHWILTREQRLAIRADLPEDNRILEGELWSDPERAEVSVEKDYARDLGVKVGSEITLDVQGVPLDLAVTSIRTVEWETFGINFFLFVEPGVLTDAPQFRLAAARLPEGGEQRIQDRIAAAFPNVTTIRIRQFLDRIAEVLRRTGLGVRILGGFTVVTGILILGGAVSAGSLRRGREVALLKTLGMTRRGVLGVYAVEYALVGSVAGALGVVGGGVLAWSVLDRWMEIPWEFRAVPLAAALAGAVLLAVGAGTVASFRALTRRPVEILRDE